MLNQHIDVWSSRGERVAPTDQPIKPVVVCPDGAHNQWPHPAFCSTDIGHSSGPITSAAGYCRRCSSHCTHMREMKGRHSRAVNVAESIRS